MSKIDYATDRMKKHYELSLDEIEKVLSDKKPITDKTRLAANVVSNYAKLKQSEVHDKGLEIMREKMQLKAIE